MCGQLGSLATTFIDEAFGQLLDHEDSKLISGLVHYLIHHLMALWEVMGI